ncbi:carboxypeptidase-like regulatory domain-containing protein [candidate division CSSED10-310 bacterium]|uniref:Carboxypeptidase-like regulatory domain-containing protein n=1 Tax=candidate division CSSED10-310 bacterium TaxID=2855610 RepID=A0ABV6YRW5_UNCC1
MFNFELYMVSESYQPYINQTLVEAINYVSPDQAVIIPGGSITSTDGSYKIDHISSNNATFVVQCPGYNHQNIIVRELNPGEERGNVNHICIPRTDFIVSGTVIDGSILEPINDVIVTFLEIDGTERGSAITNENGLFEIKGLKKSEYMVVFHKNNYKFYKIPALSVNKNVSDLGNINLDPEK